MVVVHMLPAIINRDPGGSVHRVARKLVLSSLCLVVAACHRGTPEPPPGPEARTTLKVQNEGFPDMTIYVLRSSERIRLGTVTGNTTTTLTIPSYVLAGPTTLRFLADPVGGVRAPVSEEITVSPGDRVELIIPPSGGG